MPQPQLVQAIGLPLVIASGLSVGKEGPSVHYAACVGNVIPKFFKRFDRSYVNQSQFLTAAASAGVAVAFGSPIGGVLFGLEDITSSFRLSTLWKSYYCALVATGILSLINPFRTGQIVIFEVKYESDWKYSEIPFFIILGIFGGVYGILVSKFNIKAVAFRQKYLSNSGIKEVVLLCLFTSMTGYFNEFIRLDMTEGMEVLFHECGDGYDHGLCKADGSSKVAFFFSLIYATIMRMLLVIISYGAKVPCGIFVPSMAAGATFGRAIGILAELMFPCKEGSDQCIIAGTYAFLGAASALSGITHLTVAVVVIMFELTGAIRYIIPTMICVGVTKMINDNFSNGCGGIADQMIKFNGMPFIDVKEDHDFEDATVEEAMTDTVIALPYIGLVVQDIETLLAKCKFSVFPVIYHSENPIVLGYVQRADLLAYMNKMKKERVGGVNPEDGIRFVTDNKLVLLVEDHILNSLSNSQILEGSRDILFEPVVKFQFFRASVDASLNSVLQTFIKLGPRMLIVEDQGKLAGIISRKDLIKFELFLHHLQHENIFVSNKDYTIFSKFWEALNSLNSIVGGLVGQIRGRVLGNRGFEPIAQ
ncbi:unnamed protein product [Ambrosiozyma monospora]|uniref:Chloride channel protein n=1 Tax=Ambrosiozyma monospora TaxID=43982 RepID=A0A9W6Z695_AMBMO|nr:unnamed protein product [Ambrosiozyma monospora]